MDKQTGYELSRNWFDFCFENPEKIKPNHTAVYFFAIEHCNRLGWKSKFGFPSAMVMEAIGIKSYNTYIKTLNDLVEYGFIKMIEKSKNQYSSNIIALSNFNKALDKALDKALIKHTTKQIVKQRESIDSIDKQETINKEQETINNKALIFTYQKFITLFNEITGRNFKGCSKSEHQFNARIKKYNEAEFGIAIRSAHKDDYLRQNPKYLTPEYISRENQMEKWLNVIEGEKKGTIYDINPDISKDPNRLKWTK